MCVCEKEEFPVLPFAIPNERKGCFHLSVIAAISKHATVEGTLMFLGVSESGPRGSDPARFSVLQGGKRPSPGRCRPRFPSSRSENPTGSQRFEVWTPTPHSSCLPPETQRKFCVHVLEALVQQNPGTILKIQESKGERVIIIDY